MLAQKQLNDLAERRRLLVVEAELHRSVIALEGDHLRTQLDWLGRLREGAFAGKSWLAVGGAVAGLFAARRRPKLGRWMLTALSAFRLVRAFVSR